MHLFSISMDILQFEWERWEIELLGYLEMIVGANGISLSYVIRHNSVLDHNDQLMWYENQD